MSVALYHLDLNGNCSVNVIRTFDPKVWPVPCGYQTIPWESFKKGDKVYVVGLFPDKADLEKIAESCDLWVYTNNDKQIEICNELIKKGCRINGTRKITEASCLSLWKDFSPNKSVPKIVQYISDYHVWKFEFPETEAIQIALTLYNTKPSKKTVPLWDRLFFNEHDLLKTVLQTGQEILEYQDTLFQEYRDDLAYGTKILKHSALAANVRQSSKILSGHRNEHYYDVLLNYAYDGKINKYRVSVYSNKDKVNAGHICEQFGGKGSTSVGGFICKDLPFEEKQIKHTNAIDGDDPLPFVDIYSTSNRMKAKSFPINKYVTHQEKLDMVLRHTFVEFGGYSAIVCNTPSTTIDGFTSVELCGQSIAISYVWCNFGQYRIIVFPLFKSVDLSSIITNYHGKLIKNAVWFYSKTLPFKLDYREV